MADVQQIWTLIVGSFLCSRELDQARIIKKKTLGIGASEETTVQ
jgi:hypothetical protein